MKNSNFTKILTAGSVDSGKSTLLGRILYDTENYNLDELENVIAKTKKNPHFKSKIDFSLLLDGLLDEATEGITIDLAHKYFQYNDKNYVFIDSPGHIEYLQNTASGATFADIALLLIDSKVGITQQTQNHLEIVNMFSNIKKIIVCINKIDSIKQPEKIYKTYKQKINEFCIEKGFEIPQVIPISALEGQNIKNRSKKMNFYNGPSLLNLIEKDYQEKNTNNFGTIAIVQNVLRGENNDRIFTIKNLNSRFSIGSPLYNARTNEKITVKKIFKDFDSKKTIQKNETANVQINEKATLNNSDILLKEVNNLIQTSSIKVTYVHISREIEISKSQRIQLNFRNQKVNGYISKIENKQNSSIISFLTIELENKIFLTEYSKFSALAVFSIIDISDNETLGFGFVNHSLDKGVHVIESETSKFINTKNKIKCFWLTGLPSSGKTTIANSLGLELAKNDKSFYIIDGDSIRSNLNSDLGFTKSDRIENNRRVAHLAKILYDSGVIPIVSTVSPNQSSREFARSLFPDGDFIEVFVNTSLEECIKRDVKDLYKSDKKIKNITGIHTNYDIPSSPEVILDTENLSLEEETQILLDLLIKE